MSSGSDCTECASVIIPELEDYIREHVPSGRYWTEDEDAKLCRYYRKVPMRMLAKSLNRTVSALNHRARKIGLAHEVRRPMDTVHPLDR